MKINISAVSNNNIINLPLSKSIANRILIINQLSKGKIIFENNADSDDVLILKNALENNHLTIIDIGHAGTAMRFLTAYYCIEEGERIITGSDRMKHRPILTLVDTLKQLGANIQYLEKEGFPPLKITGTKIKGGQFSIQGNTSSQYISALLMIAPYFEEGLELRMEGDLVSFPYIEMTLKLMEQCGIKIEWVKQNTIRVFPGQYRETKLNIESDWSAASYWYELLALKGKGKLTLSNLYKCSLQGDSGIANIFNNFGIETLFHSDSIEIINIGKATTNFIELNLINTPDLAQTIACTCAGLKINCKLTGLSTLLIKETNRLNALQNELSKFGIISKISADSFEILSYKTPLHLLSIDTYQDHRMAMAVAPLSVVYGAIQIKNPEVVHKSYPTFWKDLQLITS
jgi:3-phosphoshikimate 1-carboxyvinyltransferase